MAARIKLSDADVALLTNCEPEQQVRRFRNSLYNRGENGPKFLVPQIEYTPLDVEQPEARLLKLHPTSDVHTILSSAHGFRGRWLSHSTYS